VRISFDTAKLASLASDEAAQTDEEGNDDVEDS
jgi:hypothetical protein